MPTGSVNFTVNRRVRNFQKKGSIRTGFHLEGLLPAIKNRSLLVKMLAPATTPIKKLFSSFKKKKNTATFKLDFVLKVRYRTKGIQHINRT